MPRRYSVNFRREKKKKKKERKEKRKKKNVKDSVRGIFIKGRL